MKKGIKSNILVSLMGGHGQLKEELVYYISNLSPNSLRKILGNSGKIIAPENYCTDFASIPSFLHSFFSKLGRHNNAAILHDYLYEFGMNEYKINRKAADDVFLHCLKILNVRKSKRIAMYIAVRAFGKSRFLLK